MIQNNMNMVKYKLFGAINNLQRKYFLYDEHDNEIGSAEGYIKNSIQFVCIIKIYDPQNHNKGIGFQVFKRIYDELNSISEIKIIIGSWHSGGEFQDFEDNMSTNMKIFLSCKDKENNSEHCAFLTPTGRWAKKLGFEECEVIKASNKEVLVHFKKQVK